jgi:hypothetical protein
MGGKKLTAPQRRALAFLATKDRVGARSAEIGNAMDDGSYPSSRLGLRAQGAGRLGAMKS